MNVWEFRQMYESQISMEGLVIFAFVVIIVSILYGYFISVDASPRLKSGDSSFADWNSCFIG